MKNFIILLAVVYVSCTFIASCSDDADEFLNDVSKTIPTLNDSIRLSLKNSADTINPNIIPLIYENGKLYETITQLKNQPITFIITDEMNNVIDTVYSVPERDFLRMAPSEIMPDINLPPVTVTIHATFFYLERGNPIKIYSYATADNNFYLINHWEQDPISRGFWINDNMAIKYYIQGVATLTYNLWNSVTGVVTTYSIERSFFDNGIYYPPTT